MRRTAPILALFLLAPFLMGGGLAPPTPEFVAGHKIVGPAISTFVVLDPGDGIGFDGLVTMRFDKGAVRSSALVFSELVSQWGFGCDPVATLAQTQGRFLNSILVGPEGFAEPQLFGEEVSPLGTPTAPAVRRAFQDLGFTVSLDLLPVFTEVSNAVCTDPTPGDPGDEALSFQGVVQFFVPR